MNYSRLALIVAVMLACSARADLINVPTIGVVNMLPNTQSTYTTVSINDLNAGVPTDILAWSLGFRVVPLSGATGTVTLDLSTPYPDSNNIFTNPFPLAAPTQGINSPDAGDLTVSSSDGNFTGVTVPGGIGKNLVKIRFNASNNATGNFALQLVDSGSHQNTFWVDNGVGDGHNFLVNGQAFVSGISLGTISLPAAPIPEPSGLVLTGAVLALAAWRRRRKQAAQVPATP